MLWVVAYDVRSNSKRARIARRLEQVGFRRQKSVFEGEVSPREIQGLLEELNAFLESEHDVLTAWPTVENPSARIVHRGVPRVPTKRDWFLL